MKETKKGRDYQKLPKCRPEQSTMAYMAAHGATIDEMAKAFGFSKDNVKKLMMSTRMQAEVERLRASIYGNPSQRIKTILPEAIEVDYGIMMDEDVKPNVRHSVAKNFMEQALGKPKQHLQVDGGFTIRNLFEKLDKAGLMPPEQKPVELEEAQLVESAEAPDESNIDEFVKGFDVEE